MKIQILVDNPDSWILPYAERLKLQLKKTYDSVMLLHDHNHVEKGDILCLLSCEKIFKSLHLNKHNLVVHESELPRGKGWSPLTWQILEGKNLIPVTLFEATEKVDEGDIYEQEFLSFEGHELLTEMKDAQGRITIRLIEKFIEKYPNVKCNPQIGESSYYSKRTPKDSELDLDLSLRSQFNNLRVVDNERYPAFFLKDGIKYILKIEKYEK